MLEFGTILRDQSSVVPIREVQELGTILRHVTGRLGALVMKQESVIQWFSEKSRIVIEFPGSDATKKLELVIPHSNLVAVHNLQVKTQLPIDRPGSHLNPRF
jgi:hypothetical protein